MSSEQQTPAMPPTVPAAPTSTSSFAALTDPTTLFGQTLRTMVLLVGACVLFMGALSTAAVLITSKAVGPRGDHDTTEAREISSSSGKKPLSI
jgi:hypothetical protein